MLAGGSPQFVPNAPSGLRAARTCYDHLAGTLGVSMHDRFKALRWLLADSTGIDQAYEVSKDGSKAIKGLGIDLETIRKLRRRFAYACLDWSERRPHLGGALGAAILEVALKRKWVARELDSRALAITALGRREMLARFGLQV